MKRSIVFACIFAGLVSSSFGEALTNVAFASGEEIELFRIGDSIRNQWIKVPEVENRTQNTTVTVVLRKMRPATGLSGSSELVGRLQVYEPSGNGAVTAVYQVTDSKPKYTRMDILAIRDQSEPGLAFEIEATAKDWYSGDAATLTKVWFL